MSLSVSRRRPTNPRRGGVLVWVVLFVSMTGGGLWWLANRRASEGAKGTSHNAVLHTVERRDFELLITENGEVESAGSTEVRSEVKSMNAAGIAILRIIPEGTEVKGGDFLVELDSSALRSDRTLQQIVVNTAEAASVEAKNLYETAEIARQEYLEGLFVQERQTIEGEAFVAEENLSRAEDYLAYSEKLAAKGYVNELQLEADRFAVEKSRKELDTAKTKLRVLEDFTRTKMLKQLDSDIVITKAKWESLKKSYELDAGKLRDIEDQIAKCVVTAPKEGTVKYAHGNNEREGGEFVVEEGAVIRERQAIIRLPDPTKMEVACEVNESLVQYVRKGMDATVSPVGMSDVVLPARVARVNQYAEPTNWRRANVKDYKAFVAIEGQSDRLKSGMTAAVVIRALFVPEAVLVPVQSIYAHGDKTYCFVERERKLVAQPVLIGPSNDRFLVIESGVVPGDRVAMDPRKMLDLVDLPEIAPEERQQAVDTGATASRTARGAKVRVADAGASADKGG
ncbi:MAG: efflux RND transporter periplasmic adaptor subunit [Lacipirellulaceae bacterium]